MRRAAVLAAFLVLCANLCFGQSDSDVFKMTNPVQTLTAATFASPPSETAEPYKSGLIEPRYATTLLKNLGADPTKTTIIHVLRWADAGHQKIKFEKWYLFDPTPSRTSFYLQSSQEVFERTAIPGRTEFQFVYIHLNAKLASGQDEWKDQSAAGTKLKYYVSYSITVTKAQTQFIQDLTTLLQILGVASASALAVPPPGYFSFTTFTSRWTTSTIAIAASFTDPNAKVQGNTSTSAPATKQVSSTKSYTNEKPSWFGLSAGVPITTYKDVTYQTGSNTLVPTSITKQDTYVFLDAYLPPVLPSLASFRYIPQPFFGLPLKGKVFEHTMLGAGIGLHWVEPFGGVIFDTQNQKISGTTKKTGVTYQAVFGIKLSITALGKALKGSK